MASESADSRPRTPPHGATALPFPHSGRGVTFLRKVHRRAMSWKGVTRLRQRRECGMLKAIRRRPRVVGIGWPNW